MNTKYFNKVQYEKEEMIVVYMKGSKVPVIYIPRYKNIIEKIDHDFDKQNSKLKHLNNQLKV